MPDLYQPMFDEPADVGWAYISAVMVLPRGNLATHEAAAVHYLYQMVDFEDASSVSVEGALTVAKAMRDAPRVEKLARREAFGLLAGFILITILRAAEHGHAQFGSVGRVLRCASQVFRQNGIARGASVENLGIVWREYRSVSHLWAGLAYATNPEVSQEGLLQCLAFAEEFRRRGEAYRHPHRPQKLLNSSEMWKAPNGLPLPAVNLLLPPLSEDELGLLKI